ncbi:MAG: iron-sulfur cluster assembly scaffold protein [Paracoccaceae bacterium]
MSDTDLIKLYSQRILALAADIPHLARLDQPTASASCRAPLCGSTITVDLALTDGRISGFGQDVRACALGQASAAIAGAAMIGRSEAEVTAALAELEAMLASGGPVPAPPFEGYEVLTPARDYKNRHASILLVLRATAAAFAESHAKG